MTRMPTTATFVQNDSLELMRLLARYRDDRLEPVAVIAAVLDRIDKYSDPAVWITRLSHENVNCQLMAAVSRRAAGIAQPLLGIPFAIKDNIDFAGQPTTAACPAFGHIAERSATVVQRLCDAGAILIGKTNLDQFATGLVGTRSPYGICKNVFDDRYISGGSSSGSAVAVAAGLVSFALGTDTAGSGRVPASFNNLVGLKPSRGLISASGVVPACQSLDCVSIFSHTCQAAAYVLQIAAGYDPTDPYSRNQYPSPKRDFSSALQFRFGVLADADREFFGDEEAASNYQRSVNIARALGGSPVTIDFAPFTEAAALLYDGPWVAERTIAAATLLRDQPDSLLPITRMILQKGLDLSGVRVFEGLHRLESLRQRVAGQWDQMDFLLLPTTGTIYTIEQVLADPLRTNSNLGRYTNFVNLLDLCAVAVPAGFRTDGLPMGVTVMAPAGADRPLLVIADRLHQAMMDQGEIVMKSPTPSQANKSDSRRLKLAVVGAHLSGMALNNQLQEFGATLVRACKTAPLYRLYALPGTTPPKPGLVRVSIEVGVSIQVEVWEMGVEAFGNFVAAIPGPLGIGSIVMEDNFPVQGFLCESYAVMHATDISNFGGWRAYIASLSVV